MLVLPHMLPEFRSRHHPLLYHLGIALEVAHSTVADSLVADNLVVDLVDHSILPVVVPADNLAGGTEDHIPSADLERSHR